MAFIYSHCTFLILPNLKTTHPHVLLQHHICQALSLGWGIQLVDANIFSGGVGGERVVYFD